MTTTTKSSIPSAPRSIWIAQVSTRYEITATALDPEEAIRIACEAALGWLRQQGVREHESPEDVREFFGVCAIEVPLGGFAVQGSAPTFSGGVL